jgi:hypothetical protein
LFRHVERIETRESQIQSVPTRRRPTPTADAASCTVSRPGKMKPSSGCRCGGRLPLTVGVGSEMSDAKRRHALVRRESAILFVRPIEPAATLTRRPPETNRNPAYHSPPRFTNELLWRQAAAINRVVPVWEVGLNTSWMTRRRRCRHVLSAATRYGAMAVRARADHRA